MKIRGHEIKFLRTVKATSDIAKLCPDGNLERIGELFGNDISLTLETGAKLIHFLNEGYEMNKAFDDPDYKPNIISIDEIMYLNEKDYTELLQEAMQGMSEGTETLVKTEKPKKKVKEVQ